MINERDAQVRLFYRYSGNWIVACPNILYYWTWESDVLALTKSKLLIEYEIKLTVSDYNADFKNKKRKHEFLNNQNGEYKKSPNRFYYVMPEEIANKIELPSYAGLIIIKNEKYVITKKNAPLLHKRKPDQKQIDRIYHALFFRAWSNIITKTKVF